MQPALDLHDCALHALGRSGPARQFDVGLEYVPESLLLAWVGRAISFNKRRQFSRSPPAVHRPECLLFPEIHMVRERSGRSEHGLWGILPKPTRHARNGVIPFEPH